MGSVNNCCSFNNPEKNLETYFNNNKRFKLLIQKKDNNNITKNFIILKNSNNDIALKKIKQKYAIMKIIKQFKQYKSKNELLSPIHKPIGESLVINTNSYSNYLLSSMKMKKIPYFLNNRKTITKLQIKRKDKDKNKEELNISKFDFNTSKSSFSKANIFQKLFQKFTNNNKNYVVYNNNYLIKQKGVIKYTIDENNFYIGEFFQNDYFGYGLFINNKKIIYEGYWQNSVQNGYGIEYWENGSIYKGEFKNAKKNGIGTYTWSDKSKYEGEWMNNCFNGYGIYYYNETKVYLGGWKMNEKNGYGIYLTNDIIYIGNYENDKKNGFGIYYWRKKKEAYIGFFENGKQYNFGKFFKNKKSKYGIWEHETKSKVKWFQNIKDAYNFMNKNDLYNYKYFFQFNIEGIINYCNIIIKDITLFCSLIVN